MNSAGKPEALGEVWQQAGAIATATQDSNGQLQWTVQQSDGSSSATQALASTTSWSPAEQGSTP
ncbi:hypothetical protein BOO86_17925 [Mycobacterium sp. CBMA 234]|nr:hypothetical protein [Mycolicibacterium sp. CBMA 234]MUM06294.1 hypothetical protein [Mycolicibacterium sp. CBMA 213]